jgi:site-specific recombinase XerD
MHAAPCADNLEHVRVILPEHGDDWDDWVRDWYFHLQHDDRTQSQGTHVAYLIDIRQFLDYLHDPEVGDSKVTEPSLVERRHIEGFLAWLKDIGRSSGTRYRRLMALKSFWRWLRDEPGSGVGQILPTDRIPIPVVSSPPKPIVYDDALAALLATCSNRTFVDLRDEAIIRLMDATGVRREELVRADTAGVDINRSDIYILGKGRKPRLVAISGTKATLALSRYLRARRKHPGAASKALFLSVRSRVDRSGPVPTVEWRMTGGAVGIMLERRCEQAGIPKIQPHRLRHTWAHHAKAAGISEEDLENQGGWAKGSPVVRRYGASVAAERAREAHRKLNLGDRI